MKYILILILLHFISNTADYFNSDSYSIETSDSKFYLTHNLLHSIDKSHQEFSWDNVPLRISRFIDNTSRAKYFTGSLPGATKEIAFMVKMRNLQKSGNKFGLQQEMQKLQQALIMVGRQDKMDIVSSILQEPITNIFDTIKNGSLEQAYAAICRLLTLSPYKYRHGPNADPNIFMHKQIHCQQNYGYDVLHEAKQLYENRDYAPLISEYSDILSIGFDTSKSTHITQKKPTSDFISTSPPSNTIDISPEINVAIMQRMPYMHELEILNLNKLANEAGAKLFDLYHNKMLSQVAITRKDVEKLCTIISKVAQEDIPYFCMRSAMAFKDRITDPVGIIIDQAKGIYAVAKFFCDMNFGRYYMSDREQLEYLESSIQTFVGITDGLKNLTLEQAADCTGLVAADLVFNFGVAKSITYIKEIGALNKTNKAFCRTVESLKKSLCTYTEKQLVTPEGIVINCADDFTKSKSVASSFSGNDVQWVDYRKHQPPRNVPWKDLLISTKNGKALYKPGINIKDLEMNAWKNGTHTTNGRNWKVFKAEQIIGANSGKETCYMRVECSANSIHGHPILESQYLELIK